MLRRFVSFVIRKEDLNRVVDSLSVYGTNRVVSMKDRSVYSVSLYCESSKLQRCLDCLLMLSEKGVWIRNLNIKYRI